MLVYYMPFFVGSTMLPIDYRHIYAINLLFFFPWFCLNIRSNINLIKTSNITRISFILASFSLLHWGIFSTINHDFNWVNFYYSIAYGVQFFMFSSMLEKNINHQKCVMVLYRVFLVLGCVGLCSFFLGLTQVANPFELPYILNINRSYFSFMLWIIFVISVVQKRCLVSLFFFIVILFNLARIIIALSFAFICFKWLLDKVNRTKSMQLLLSMIIITVIAVSIFSPLQLVFKRMVVPKVNKVTTNDIYNQESYKSDHGRLRLNKIGIQVIQEHWAVGVGAGRYWELAEKYIPIEHSQLNLAVATPHNTYLYIIAIYGIFGGLLYMMIFIEIIKKY
ncbi:MAG: O-antigen ligase family protein, partial [Gammaproteobacteria bacterium]|nr:O-antigen ligase family protein [Gammaproteobacteria bacterium]